MKSIQFAANQFTSFADAQFCEVEYSELKFGSDLVARKFGYQLADAFAKKYPSEILSNRFVVIPSPYNHVENAATIMTKHFVNRLNAIIVAQSGEHVEYSVIHRKVSYINDYGFLGKEARKGLIDNDSFFLNKDFYVGKTLIFIDDVIITGTHEDKLKEIMAEEGINNDHFFLYFAKYLGEDATIESKLNFAAVKCLSDYEAIARQSNHHVIVRPLKFLLTQDIIALIDFAKGIPLVKLEEIYYGCLGEGYYKIPSYQGQFQIIQGIYNTRMA